MTPPGASSAARIALAGAVVASGLAVAARRAWIAGAARRFAAVRGPRFGAKGSDGEAPAPEGSAGAAPTAPPVAPTAPPAPPTTPADADAPVDGAEGPA